MAVAGDVDMSIFGGGLIEAGNFFDCVAPVKQETLDLLLGGFGPSEKKEIINNSGKTFAFSRGRFDDGAIFLGGALASEGDLGLAEHVADRRS